MGGGGGKMRRRRLMRKIELGADHNQNTPSGGFEKVPSRKKRGFERKNKDFECFLKEFLTILKMIKPKSPT